MSTWFLVVISFGALFLVVGKRSAELEKVGAGITRRVLAEYTRDFLHSVLTLSASVVVTGYCLWAFDTSATGLSSAHHYIVPIRLSVVPVVVAVLFIMRSAEAGNGSAPDELLYHDRAVQALGRGVGGAAADRDLLMARERLTGWGRTAPSVADVLTPDTEEAVAEALAGSRAVIARGLGRSYGDPAQVGGGVVLSNRDLGGIGAIDEAGVVSVGAGVSVDELLAVSIPWAGSSRSRPGPARSPSAGRWPRTCTERTTTSTARSAPTCSRCASSPRPAR